MLIGEDLSDPQELQARGRVLRSQIRMLRARLAHVLAADERSSLADQLSKAEGQLRALGGELAIAAEHAPMIRALAEVSEPTAPPVKF